jgi:hypothetical protein
MNATDWLDSNFFDWLAGGLAVSLLVSSFLIIFTTIFAGRKRQK